MGIIVSLTFSLLLIVQNNSMKINIQGSLTLGKDIIRALENYALQNQMFPSSRRQVMPSRRSGSSRITGAPEDNISVLVKSRNFCRQLPICEAHDLSDFINDYVVILVHAVGDVVENLNDLSSKIPVFPSKNYSSIFRQGCNKYFGIIQECITGTNNKITVENKDYTWITLFKRISATIQGLGIQFIDSQFQGLPKEADTSAPKDKLIQKVVTGTVSVEEKFIIALCKEYQICLTKFYCTNALKAILEQLASLGDDRVTDFVGEFKEALNETTFFESLNHSIAHDFKMILENIANPKNVALKDIFTTIIKSIVQRLRYPDKEINEKKTQDVYLFNSILSDMDHFYSKRDKFPFDKFNEDFTLWSKYDGRLKPQLVRLFSEISEQLTSEHEDLVEKLTQEVKAFLQVTVDIEV